jgi:hypothetical protein
MQILIIKRFGIHPTVLNQEEFFSAENTATLQLKTICRLRVGLNRGPVFEVPYLVGGGEGAITKEIVTGAKVKGVC